MIEIILASKEKEENEHCSYYGAVQLVLYLDPNFETNTATMSYLVRWRLLPADCIGFSSEDKKESVDQKEFDNAEKAKSFFNDKIKLLD